MAFTLALLFLYSFGSALSLELLPKALPSRLHTLQQYVTVSGTEIGGVMAQTVHISHSKYIKGCAAYSSTFYRCGPAGEDAHSYKAHCMKGSNKPSSVDGAVSDIASYATNHLIDELYNLRNSYVYVYCSLENPVFSPTQQVKTVALYEHYLESPKLIETRVQDTSDLLRVLYAGENNYQVSCPRLAEPDGTVSPNCTDLSAPVEALEFLLGKYTHFRNPFYQSRYIHLEPLRSFDQTEFTEGLGTTGLDDIGYFYVPRQCQQGYGKSCLVHVYFHGCGQGREFLGTTHVLYSNYLEIAEVNNLIMLFPQVLSSPDNPGGCWDYFGYTGTQYATKNGPQVQAIWKMIERVLYIQEDNKYPSHSSPSPQPFSSYYRARASPAGARAHTKYDYNPTPYQENTPPSTAPSYSPPKNQRQYQPSNLRGSSKYSATKVQTGTKPSTKYSKTKRCSGQPGLTTCQNAPFYGQFNM